MWHYVSLSLNIQKLIKFSYRYVPAFIYAPGRDANHVPPSSAEVENE
jgi:hypothetical protein